MSSVKTRKKKKQNMQLMLMLLAVFALILIVLLLLPGAGGKESVISAILPPAEPKIPRGTMISGISVSRMTEEDAFRKVSAKLLDSCGKQDFMVYLDGSHIVLTPQITQAHWKIAEAVELAMQGVSSEAELYIDRDAIRRELKTLYRTKGGEYVSSAYWLDGDKPDLRDGQMDCQTLVLRKGSNGLEADLDKIIDQIRQFIENGVYEIQLDNPGNKKSTVDLDLQDIYDFYRIDPVNPSLDHESLEPVPGVLGYDFDLTEAEVALEKTEPGEILRIPMRYVDPEVSMEDVWFLDTLGSCSTSHTDEENRNVNLELACTAIDGTILQPGEVLSYNEALGQRTTAAGYKPAPAYSGTELINEIGGGICQVSSTLYLSSLFAELKIVERKNHGFPANYIPLGLDATVNWGTTDLKIRNDYEYPIKIVARVDEENVVVKIMGVDLRDYYVKIEYRVDDHPSHADAFRCRYDKETDEQIYRKLDHTSYYLEDVWCWPGYAENS